MHSTTISRITVIRAGALGDVILTLPALKALRTRYPDASIHVVGYPEIWQVAGGLVDGVLPIDSPLFASLYSAVPSPELHAWLRQLDLVVAWMARDPAPALRTDAGPEIIWASPYPPPGVHAAQWLLDTIAPHAGHVTDPEAWHLPLTAGELSRGLTTLARLGLDSPIFLHPGAGATWKRWPVERFALLANRLHDRGYPIALIEGPADADVIRSMQSSAELPIIRDVSVRDLAGILAHGRGFVGNDSGVTHLAAVTGIPTVALFGPTDPRQWRPLADTHILRACEIPAAVQGKVRVCEDADCMERLSVDSVLTHVENFVENRAHPVEIGPAGVEE